MRPVRGLYAVWQMIKRLDSSFDSMQHGYTSFSAMVQAFGARIDIREKSPAQQMRLC